MRKTKIKIKLNSISFDKNALAIALLIVRIFIGVAMLTHGYPKLQKLVSGEEIQFVNVFGMGAKISLILAALSKVICSILIILGLFTRTFIIPLIITMIIAGFFVRAADPFADRELAFLYLTVYFLILVLGGGRYSIDALLAKKATLRY